jgi:hypothetical protein
VPAVASAYSVSVAGCRTVPRLRSSRPRPILGSHQLRRVRDGSSFSHRRASGRRCYPGLRLRNEQVGCGQFVDERFAIAQRQSSEQSRLTVPAGRLLGAALRSRFYPATIAQATA